MLGNLLAERGDLSAALTAYEQAVDLARQAGDDYQQVLAYNNLAYHALLLGETDRAHAEIEKAFALAEARALRLPLQHLYSTRGEIALAEKNWQEAEDWFKRGLAEAEHNGNRREQANSHANLGLAAMGRGDSDAAVMLLETARREVSELPEPHLRARTELELAQVYFERGERSAAREALDRARTMLVSSSRKTLQEWTDRLEAQIGPPRRERARRAGH
jgi:tetratricopeptide (TPR) repeat protein